MGHVSDGAPRAAARWSHQPALDGLRGVAVAAVLAYHAGFAWARGGFLGVDAFFVLSGYLITGLLLAEHRSTGRIDLLAFWQRRLRRLVPALVLLLAGVAVYAAIFAGPDELPGIRADAFAAAFYVTNWQAIVRDASYFAQFAAPSPLQHTWSLAVEEQWYIVWPIVVIALLRLRTGSPRVVAAACVVLAIASAAWMAYLHDPSSDPSRVYYGTDTRAQSLLIGAMLACVLAGGAGVPSSAPVRLGVQAAGLAAACATAALWITLRSESAWLYQGGFLLLALLVATVIVAAIQPGRYPLRLMLSVAPLRALGRISYGVYLVHWPIYLVLTPDRTGLDPYPLFALRVATTIAIATCSFVLVERPVLQQTWSWSRARMPQTLGVATAGVAVVLAVMVLVTRDDAPGDAPVAVAAEDAAMPNEEETDASALRVLVVGDSVAYTLAGGLARVGEEQGIAVWNQSKIGCGIIQSDEAFIDGNWTPANPDCEAWASEWPSMIDSFQPDVVIVLAGAWDLYDRRTGETTLRFGSPEADRFAKEQIARTTDTLSAGGARVVMLTTPHYQPPDLGLSVEEPRFDAARIDALNGIYGAIATERAERLRVVDLGAFVERHAGGVRALTDDGVHFTPSGAETVARWLVPQIDGAPRVERRQASASVSIARAQAPRWRTLLASVPASNSIVMNDYARFRALFGVDTGDEASYARALRFSDDGRSRALVPAAGWGPHSQTRSPALKDVALSSVEADVVGGSGEFALLADGRIVTLSGAAWRESDVTALSAFDGLAAALEREGTYSAAFSVDTQQFDAAEQARRIAGPDEVHETASDALRRLRGEGLLARFEAYATGAGIDDRGAYTTVVLQHASAAEAAANADALRSRIANGSSWVAEETFASLFANVEIRAEGTLVIARLRGDRLAYWYAVHGAGDSLLAWE